MLLACCVASAHRCATRRARHATAPALAAAATRRAALRYAATAAGFGAAPALAEKPYNPLNLKGQFWETGSLIYTKPERPDPEQVERNAALARERLGATLAALRAARRDADAGDAAAVLDALRDADVSERTIRLDGQALVDAAEDPYVPREQLSRAAAALSRVLAAAEVRRSPAAGAATATAVTALSATGLVYVVPGAPSIVNNALERSRVSGDPGLDVVVALEDCIAAVSLLLRPEQDEPPAAAATKARGRPR